MVIGLLGVLAASKQCRKLDASLSKLCGYEYTADFQLESHFNSSRRAVYHIAHLLSNCSEYSSLIACALYLPRCEEHIPGPYLPCKRVCDEYIKDCGDRIIENGLEWSAGMCQLLPNSDDPNTDKGYLGRCFEPPDFKLTSGESVQLIWDWTTENVKYCFLPQLNLAVDELYLFRDKSEQTNTSAPLGFHFGLILAAENASKFVARSQYRVETLKTSSHSVITDLSHMKRNSAPSASAAKMQGPSTITINYEMATNSITFQLCAPGSSFSLSFVLRDFLARCYLSVSYRVLFQ